MIKTKVCSQCKSDCFINEWEGWRWECCRCGAMYREATEAEIEDFENNTL